MGIALKRRDNAPIVKYIFGGAIDIVMKDHDVAKARKFVLDECQKLLKGGFPLDQFIISKTLKSYYKKPRQIAHNVLACRQAQRDPGNRFEPNDRVPYAFVVNHTKGVLQGDRIETPEFIQQNKLTLDYQMYITNQIMKPVSQIFELVPGYENMEQLFTVMMGIYENERTGNISLTKFFKPQSNPCQITKLSDLIKQRKAAREALDAEALDTEALDTEALDTEVLDAVQEVVGDDEVETVQEVGDDEVEMEEEEEEEEEVVESTSNYDNPYF
jgi:hypothetical protein